ncbi:MAG: DNA/RNA nuclease SfsA [Myxococcota bacterium]
MRLPPLRPATLVRRYKRFLGDLRFDDGTEAVAHVPNPGRMTACLRDGETPVLVSEAAGPARKLRWTVELAMPGDAWVLVHPGRANAIVGEALAAGGIPELAGYAQARPEQRYGEGSRIDWLLTDGARPAYVEVKNATLVRDGIACFPDAVTARGARHLAELEGIVAAGARGVLLFHMGRPNAAAVTPTDDVDPVYGAALRRALRAGVEVLAYRSVVTPDAVTLGEALPVRV